MTAIPTQAHICPVKKKKLGAAQIVLIIVMMLFVLICTLPFINVIAMSMSSKSAILRGAVSFWPVEFNVDAYKLIVSDNSMWHSLFYTIELTVIYTLLAMVMTILAAFPLSMRRLKGQRVIMFFIVFTMYFSGGLIPSYLLMGNLHLMNTYASMILPGLVGTYNMILIRNYFQSIPQDLEDACMIDGAGQFTTFYKIIIPVSTPILATVALWLAVGHWNSWFDVLLYMRNEERMTLQIILRRIVLEGTQQLLDMSSNSTLDDTQVVSSDGLKAATIYVATLPILLVYPFVQKYFVKGIMVGSLKG